MRRFRVENLKLDAVDEYGRRKATEMIVTLYNPPFEDEDVLSKTKWKVKDCIITEIKEYQEEE
jgi:hypothetical protein